MFDFSSDHLPEPLVRALQQMAFSKPTPIQEQSIPRVLEGGDLIACAQTGSGKTAAFGIPLVVKLINDPDARALVLAPTRELAKQIADVLILLTQYLPRVQTAVLIGGASMFKQRNALQRQPRIIVATPGRLNDHLRRQGQLLQKTRFLVLDEGDRMLDMGFAPQLDAILKFLPKERQTLLFSATLAPAVRKLAQKYLHQPGEVSVGPQSQPVEKIKQVALQTTHATKNDLLLDELNARNGSVLIFTRTQHRTDKVARYLEGYGFPVSRIHGGRTQGQRNQALNGFRNGKFRILVATDIAARGIDVPQIAHVINYDLPMMAEDYVHRVGRTARGGASGEAVSLLTPDDQGAWIKLARQFKIPGVDLGADPGTKKKKHSGRKKPFHKKSFKQRPRSRA